MSIITAAPVPAARPCTPAQRVTRSLLGYGVLAGPLYVTVALAQAFTRDGFDLARHQWSLLANGALGWIQITNLVVTGLMVVAFGAGLRRALRGGPGATWAPRLIACYGLSLIGAGVFRADPAFGFPAGTPAGPGTVSWHGMLHLLCGVAGFAALGVACFVIARRFAADRRRGWAYASRATGVLFLAGFACVAAGAGAAWANLVFTAAVLLVWGWLSAVSASLYRTV
jgi:hypothetical protein